MKKPITKPETNNLDDIISQIRSDHIGRADYFRALDTIIQARVLHAISPRIRKHLLEDITNEEIFTPLGYLDPNDITDILQELPEDRKFELHSRLSSDIQEKVTYLLGFDPATAVGMMSFDYVQIEINLHMREAEMKALEHETRTGRFPLVLAVDHGRLVGMITNATLLKTKGASLIENHLSQIPSIHYKSTSHQIVSRFQAYPHSPVVVLDDDRAIIGVLHSDDVLNILNNQRGTALYQFVGLEKEEEVTDNAKSKVKYRAKWLMINLATAFLASAVVGLFQGTIEKVVTLAVYMPIIAGMGGNAGTQAMAVMVRGLVYHNMTATEAIRVIVNEMGAGVVNGIINGIIVGVVAIVVNHNPMLAVVFFIAMIVELIAAALAGASIPLILKALNQDPASSATVFVTTVTDIVGFFTFLGLGTLLLT